ncbi:hypothetical protein FGO68_gene8542 [Halteria grandinella]|uniref:Uncharacterized protein n=1 Tax=Halteria grandinella TaxID=5974 RepID=A0A8J8T766_HALGN|nr:hypothetical protein FGO68_gene8542 [Halteria grandinella]
MSSPQYRHLDSPPQKHKQSPSQQFAVPKLQLNQISEDSPARPSLNKQKSHLLGTIPGLNTGNSKNPSLINSVSNKQSQIDQSAKLNIAAETESDLHYMQEVIQRVKDEVESERINIGDKILQVFSDLAGMANTSQSPDQEREQQIEEVEYLVEEVSEVERTLQKVLNISVFLVDRTQLLINENKQLNEQSNMLQFQLQEANTQIGTLQDKLDSTNYKCKLQKATLKENDAMIANLQAQIQEQIEAINQLDMSANENAQRQTVARSTSFIMLQQQYSSDRNDHVRQLMEKDSKINELESLLAEQTSRYHIEANLAMKLEAQMAKMQADQEDFNGQIEDLEALVDEKQAHIDELEDECAQLEDLINQKDLEIKSLTEANKLIRGGTSEVIRTQAQQNQDAHNLDESFHQYQTPQRKVMEKAKPHKHHQIEHKWSEELDKVINKLKDNPSNQGSFLNMSGMTGTRKTETQKHEKGQRVKDQIKAHHRKELSQTVIEAPIPNQPHDQNLANNSAVLDSKKQQFELREGPVSAFGQQKQQNYPILQVAPHSARNQKSKKFVINQRIIEEDENIDDDQQQHPYLQTAGLETLANEVFDNKEAMSRHQIYEPSEMMLKDDEFFQFNNNQDNSSGNQHSNGNNNTRHTRKPPLQIHVQDQIPETEFYGEPNGSVIEYQSRFDQSVGNGYDFYGNNGGGYTDRTLQEDNRSIQASAIKPKNVNFKLQDQQQITQSPLNITNPQVVTVNNYNIVHKIDVHGVSPDESKQLLQEQSIDTSQTRRVTITAKGAQQNAKATQNLNQLLSMSFKSNVGSRSRERGQQKVQQSAQNLNVQRTYMVSNIEHTKSKLIVDPKTNQIHLENDTANLDILRIYFHFSIIAFLMQNASNSSLFSTCAQINMDTLYEEAQLKELKFFEWPRFINAKLVEYYHERRRMARKSKMLMAEGGMPKSMQLTDFELIDDHFEQPVILSATNQKPRGSAKAKEERKSKKIQ